MLGCVIMSRARLVPLLLGGLTLVACGAADTPEQPPPDDGAAAGNPGPAPVAPGSDAELREGTYTVPVVPELESFATFDVGDVRFRQRDGQLELSYELPALLVGERQRLSFRGSNAADAAGNVVLSGDSGTATCNTEQGLVRCDEVLPGVVLDADKLERELSAFEPEERAARRAIAEQFSVDPIGVLRFAP